MKISTTMLRTTMLVLTLFATASSFAHNVRFPPFTDNLMITPTLTKSGAQLQLSYQSNNDINITGPSINNGKPFAIHISSNNKIENGFPSILFTYHFENTAKTCLVTFIDGPWAMLNYREKTPPTCDGLTFGPVTIAGSYQYRLNIKDN